MRREVGIESGTISSRKSDAVVDAAQQWPTVMTDDVKLRAASLPPSPGQMFSFRLVIPFPIP